MKENKQLIQKEPMFHVAKRDGISTAKAWKVRILSFLLSLVVGGIMIVIITKLNPIEVYEGIISGAIGSKRRIWVTHRDTMLLLLVAIAITPAFKMRFWNIGAEGQILVGGVATAAMMIYLGGVLPGWLLIVLMLVSSVLAGAIWGFIPAIFKAKWNTNETLFTLMLNYVAMQITTMCIILWENPAGSNSVGIINSDSQAGWIRSIGSLTYGWIVLIVLAVTLFMYIYLKYTKHGYEIAVVGESENTARYAGINVKKVTLRTMALSGAIAGLAGFLIVSGSSRTISTSTANGRGFTAIIVSWLAKFKPGAMIFISFLLIFLEKGAIQIASQFNLNENLADVLTSIILFFILGSEFFLNYEVKFRKRKEAK